MEKWSHVKSKTLCLRQVFFLFRISNVFYLKIKKLSGKQKEREREKRDRDRGREGERGKKDMDRVS